MLGRLLGIFVAEEKSRTMISRSCGEAVTGQGILGDRYFYGQGTFSKGQKKSRDITLIEIEAILALKRDYHIDVLPKDLRRNLLTENVPLNHFVGKKLLVGDVIIEGIELCEPCGYLANLINIPVKEGLKHRGGLRCRIVKGGLISIGQKISAFVD